MRLLPFKPRHIFVLLVVLLLINTVFVPERFARFYTTWPTNLLNAFTVPFTKRLTSLSNIIRSVFTRDPVDTAEAIDNQALYRQVLRLRQELAEANEEIERLSGVRDRFGLTGIDFLPARVASVTVGARRMMKIDLGDRDGVDKDDVVGAGVDLIGRVVATGPSTATVQLIIDRKTYLNVYVMSPVGDTPQRLVRAQLRYDDDRNAFVGDVDRLRDGDDVRVGDFALPADTSWPPETRYFIVGRVAAVEKHETNPALLRRIVVQPQSDPTRLSNVIVVVPRTDDRPEGSTNR